MNSINAEETEEAASEVEYLYLSADNAALRDMNALCFCWWNRAKTGNMASKTQVF